MKIEDLEKYLGRSASVILSDPPFKDWAFEKSCENDLKRPRIDYVFQHHGLDFICDGNENVRTIFIYCDKNRMFEEGITDLPFSLNRQEVKNLLGSPSKSGGLVNDSILGDLGAWDIFERHGFSIHVEYKVGSDRINKITFIRTEEV